MTKSLVNLQIEFIQDCLRKGDKRKDILSKFTKQWPGMSPTTIDRRTTAAKQSLLFELYPIKVLTQQAVVQEIEMRKINILSIIERQEILSKIARGEITIRKPVIINGKTKWLKVAPDWTDRRNAIIELNKMDGLYQTIKGSINDNREVVFEIEG